MIKLPLIRVAHPSQEECEKEYRKVTGQLDGKAVSPQKFDDGNVEIEQSAYQPRRPDYTPHLFNFEHPYDPELTPRKKWKAAVASLDSIVDQEREKCRTMEIQALE